MGQGVTCGHAAPWQSWCNLRSGCSLLLLLVVTHHSFLPLLFFTISHLPLGFFFTSSGVAFGGKCLLVPFLFWSTGLAPLEAWLIRGRGPIQVSLHAPTSDCLSDMSLAACAGSEAMPTL